MRLVRLAALAAVVLGVLAGRGDASTVIRMTNEELAKRADVIFIGKCVKQEAKAGEGTVTIKTEYTFEVSEFLKGGDGAKTFKFDALGGKLGDRTWMISGSATFANDEEVLVFLDAAHPKTGCRYTIGLAQGKFTVKEEPDTKKKYVIRDLGGIRFADADGKVEEPKAGEGERVYLEPFVKEIKGYIEKQKTEKTEKSDKNEKK